MGDAYFGVYLWAMGAGRPRSSGEIRRLLRDAGFAHAKCVSTRRPILASVVVAH
jgi:demethylspheroidene O-methyltransferase